MDGRRSGKGEKGKKGQAKRSRMEGRRRRGGKSNVTKRK